jgi:hypothetical protein
VYHNDLKDLYNSINYYELINFSIMNNLNTSSRHNFLTKDTEKFTIRVNLMRKTTVFFSKLLTVLYCFVLLSSCNNDDIIDEQVVTIHPTFQVVKISAS